MRRPTLTERSQILLTGVLIACVVVSLVVNSYVPSAVALALAVLLLVVRTPASPDSERQPGRRKD